VHHLIDLVQEIKPALGILRLGNPGVHAAGDLVYVVSYVMNFRSQGFDLLRGPRPNRGPFQEADEVGSLGKAASLGLGGKQCSLFLR